MRFLLVVTSLLLIASCKPDKPVYADLDNSIDDPVNGPLNSLIKSPVSGPMSYTDLGQLNPPKSRIHDLYAPPNALKVIGKPARYQTENLCKLRDCLP